MVRSYRCFILFITIANIWAAPTPELFREYEMHCMTPSDINEHVPLLRLLAKECASVVEIGVNEIVSTWGLLQGLSESKSDHLIYTGIDLKYPHFHKLFLAAEIAESAGVFFQFIQGNVFDLDIESTDLLFIDSWHTYCHLTYELEKFAPKVERYIALHDTSEPWGDQDEPCYQPTVPVYPSHIDRFKRGLWPAVTDFLKTHPEWRLKERRLNNHGFTVLERIR